MAVYTVSISDGTTLSSLAVAAGRGPKGDGFTAGTYDASTGIVTFTSNDGIGFSTDDLRGNLSEPGPIGDVTPNTGAFTTLSSTGDTVIGGNLTVEGTTTTVDSTTVAIADKNVELAKDATTAAEADGGGITLNGAAATITYSSANDHWALNKGLNVSGNVSLSGTVDGRDVAADGSKLDGIESNATADQTASEIKTAYESNADTNAFTDAEQTKLSNVETNADVTDTANVTAAGALMDSELTSEASVKALDQGVATTDSPEFSGATINGQITGTAIQSSPTDTTAGSLMPVGAGGLVRPEGFFSGLRIADLDDGPNLVTGLWDFTPSTSGTFPPGASSYGYVFIERQATNQVKMTLTNSNGTGVFYRSGGGDPFSWRPWQKFYTTENIVGTVSQSGSTPTGAVIERGSNANGEYVRYADGTQICWRAVSPDWSESSTQEFDLPAAFVENKIPCTVSAENGSGPANTDFASLKAWGASGSKFFVNCFGTRPASGSELLIKATGHWY